MMQVGVLGVRRHDASQVSAVRRLACQFDVLRVVGEVEACAALASSVPSNVSVFTTNGLAIDEAKLAQDGYGEDDTVVLLDAACEYQDGVVCRMLTMFESIPLKKKAMAFSGAIYSDFFDGRASSCWESACDAPSNGYRVVNELGLDSLVCRGRDLPPHEFVAGSGDFAATRLARHAYDHRLHLLLAPSQPGWIRPRNPVSERRGGSGQRWPVEVVRDIQQYGGFSRLDPGVVRAAESWIS